MFILAYKNDSCVSGKRTSTKSPTQETKEIPDFPDGLCIVAGSESLRILSVLKGGRGEKSGFRGGDVLLEMGGLPVGNSLSEFAEHYRKERETVAKKRESLRFKVRRTSGETEQVSLRIPPAWNSAFDE